MGRRLGFEKQFSFWRSAEVYQEFVQITAGRPCDMTALSHDRLRIQGPLQWPRPLEDPQEKWDAAPVGDASSRLYTDLKFHTPDSKARFVAFHSRGLAEPPDDDYPLVLTNGRLYGHWHTQTRTGRIEKIQKMHPNPFIEIHPKDARALGIKDKDWVEVKSRRGKLVFRQLLLKALVQGLFLCRCTGANYGQTMPKRMR